jgi:hypothetical protein
MRIPVIQGLIRRRLLVNYRADPDVVQRLLPAPFRPKRHQGFAVAGVCLIRLENIRPRGAPALLGLHSENAAHRFAVEWEEDDGLHEGVFIPRRDTGSRLNHWAGGRIFPGKHGLATFSVTDRDGRIDLAMTARDDALRVQVRGEEADRWPSDSVFANVEEASRFFEPGCLGFSPAEHPQRLDGLRLEIDDWRVRPFAASEAESSYFRDEARFPAGSITFDHALVMRNVRHQWRPAVRW